MIISTLKKLRFFYKFITHNKKYFNNLSKQKKNGIILVEFNAFFFNHIVLSYLSNSLAKKYCSEIWGFFNYCLVSSPIRQGFKEKIRWILGVFFGINFFGVYKSFNVKKFIRPYISENIKNISKKKFEDIKSSVLTYNDILDLKIDKFDLGILIFDGYKIYKKEAIILIDLDDD